MKKIVLTAAVGLAVLLGGCGQKKNETPVEPEPLKMEGYLFAYFTGNDKEEEQVCYALSEDGFNFKALNDNKPVISSEEISRTGGVRDPYILRCQDDTTFYMVVTDMVSSNGWDSNRGLILLKSTDLIHWTSSAIHFPERYQGHEELKRVWAPEVIYDAEAGKYMVYFSMKHGDGPDIIYYAYANPEFTDLEDEVKPLFLPADGNSCIDGDIVIKDGIYHLFYKTEGHGNGIKEATTTSLSSGEWVEDNQYKQLTTDAVEGSGIFKLIDSDLYILIYDVYMAGRYDFAESTDLNTFTLVDQEVTMNFHPRHGSVIQLTGEEMARLKVAFPSTDTEK